MGDRIELSHAEEQAAYFALSPLLAAVAANRKQPDYAIAPIVDAIFRAVNKVRVGDPVGTIRRNPRASNSIALRVAEKPSRDDRDDVHWWRILHSDSPNVSHAGQIVVQDWPIIWTPPVAS